MHPFMFVINAIPQSENEHFWVLSQAIVHIWVIDNNMQGAKQKALEDIKKHLWIPKEIEYEFSPTAEQLLHLHKDEVSLYQKALLCGIASIYIGVPIVESPGSPPEWNTPC